jgi:TolB protein
MLANGDAETRLSNNGAADTRPTWGPGGARLAFRSDRDGNGEVYTMVATDGSGLARLTNSAGRDEPAAWLP